MAAVIADNAFWLAGGAGSVKDVEGIGRFNRDTLCRLGTEKRLVPGQVALFVEFRLELVALFDDTDFRLEVGQFDGKVERETVNFDVVVGSNPTRGS